MLYRIKYSGLKNQLPLYIELFGISHRQEPINRPQGFIYWQWFYTVEGKGELVVDGKKYILSENQGFLIAPAQGHSYKALTDTWTVHFIGFGGNLCEPLLSFLNMTKTGIYQFADPSVFLMYLEKIKTTYDPQKVDVDESIKRRWEINDTPGKDKKSRNDDLYIYSTICYEFLCAISRDIQMVGKAQVYNDNDYITNAIRYMSKNYMRSFSIDEMAKDIGVSKSYLCHIFKKEMDESLGQHLQGIRMGRACFMLLNEPTKRIGEIALECGYETPSYFTKIFRRIHGMTPEEFRARH